MNWLIGLGIGDIATISTIATAVALLLKWLIEAVIRKEMAKSGFISPAEITAIIRAEIAAANASQLLQINGTYTRSAHSNLTGAEIARLLDDLKDGLHDLQSEMQEISRYAHEWAHDLKADCVALHAANELLMDRVGNVVASQEKGCTDAP